MLDFGTLVVELLKYQDELSRRDITVNVDWGANYQLDTLTLSTTSGYKQYRFQIVRAAWNERMEFSISCNGGSFLRTTGTYCFRVDPTDGQPVKVNRNGEVGGFWGWNCNNSQTVIPEDLQYFAHQIYYSVLAELAAGLRQADNQYNEEVSSRMQLAA